MTQVELYRALESLGLPIAYNSFDTDPNNPPPNPPFLIYLFTYSDDFIADNINYKNIDNFQVELYTDKKDLSTEELVEDKLKELELPYYKSETWIESEKVFQILYEVQIIGG